MALIRAALLSRHKLLQTPFPVRKASLSANSHVEDNYYSKEGFGGSLWRNTALFSILAVIAYKYAPDPSEEVYLTRWIAMYTAPRDLWLELNAKHTALEQNNSEAVILLTDAKKPKVHRYRYPQSLDQVSPFLTPVGMSVDTSKFVVKS